MPVHFLLSLYTYNLLYAALGIAPEYGDGVLVLGSDYGVGKLGGYQTMDCV